VFLLPLNVVSLDIGLFAQASRPQTEFGAPRSAGRMSGIRIKLDPSKQYKRSATKKKFKTPKSKLLCLELGFSTT